MMNLTRLDESQARELNGGGSFCKVCGYGNDVYRSKLNVASHILKKHFGVFTAVYAGNIYKYRKLLARTLAL